MLLGLSGSLRRFQHDDSGATLTEFIILLPFFILCFQGVYTLGHLSEKNTHAPIKAYKQTFNKALAYQNSYYEVGTSWQTTAAAIDSGAQLATTSTPHNDSGVVEAVSGVWDGATQIGLGAEGTMGESFVRSWAVGQVADLNAFYEYDRSGWLSSDDFEVIQLDKPGSDRLLTRDITDIVGESELARQLLDDGTSVSNFSNISGGGAFGALMSVLSGTGLRPAIAAGNRYGTVSAKVTEVHPFPGGSIDSEAWFVTSIPPGTTGQPRVDALRATAMTRGTMHGLGPYKDLLGIKYSQPLDRESISVDSYPP
jgi:hypothetical protein